MKEKTIYVATIIDSLNYGTVLQAAATNSLLSLYGNPIFIDYCRPDWKLSGWASIYMSDSSHSKAVNLIRLISNIPARIRSYYLFRSFIKRELNLCAADPYLRSGTQFDKSAIYCVGSDQTWNKECNGGGIDPVYYLINVPNDCKKIALSASFGRTSLDNDEVEPTRAALESFKAISVRESSGVSVLKSIGINGGIPLKDPVLLCNAEYWSKLTSGIPKAVEPYVLIYALNKNPKLINYAINLGKRKRLKVKIISFNPLKPSPKGTSRVCLPRPEKWVSQFRDAAYVVTDSFHGTCFSLMFETPMIVFDPPKYSVRLRDVLNDFELTERRVSADNLLSADEIADKTIDWQRIQKLKARFSQDAKIFIDKCFDGEE